MADETPHDDAELREARERWEQRCAETSMNGYGWMRQHDILMGWIQDRPDVLRELIKSDPRPPSPSPANLPDALREAREEIESLRADASNDGARYRAMRAEIERLNSALRRLASCEAFTVPRVATEEESYRMRYAEAASRPDPFGDRRQAGEISGGDRVDMIQRTRAAYRAMTPERRAALHAAQREDFARVNLAIDRGADARRTVSGPEMVEMIQRREDAPDATQNIETVARAMSEAMGSQWESVPDDSEDGLICRRDYRIMARAAAERGEHKQPELDKGDKGNG